MMKIMAARAQNPRWSRERVIFTWGVIAQVLLGFGVLPFVVNATGNASAWFFLQMTLAGLWVAWYETIKRRHNKR